MTQNINPNNIPAEYVYISISSADSWKKRQKYLDASIQAPGSLPCPSLFPHPPPLPDTEYPNDGKTTILTFPPLSLPPPSP